MAQNYDNIPIDMLIKEILSLRKIIKKKKILIDTSKGILTHLTDRRVILHSKSFYSNMDISSLPKNDLIIVLKYFQDIQKCKNIIRYSKRPLNMKKIEDEINELLSTNNENLTTI